MVDNNYIWYVCYGSNISLERFRCYIFGGIPKYSDRMHFGAKIREEPILQSSLEIPYELYFSKSAKSWENKAVAFLKSSKSRLFKTKCVAYLIRKEQFTDILLQENGRNPFSENLMLDFSSIIKNKEYLLPPKLENIYYGRVIYLGKHKNYDALTFTAKWNDNEIQCSVPGNNYLKTIIEGIKNNFELTSDEISNYFTGICGVKDNLEKRDIENIINSLKDDE